MEQIKIGRNVGDICFSSGVKCIIHFLTFIIFLLKCIIEFLPCSCASTLCTHASFASFCTTSLSVFVFHVLITKSSNVSPHVPTISGTYLIFSLTLAPPQLLPLLLTISIPIVSILVFWPATFLLDSCVSDSLWFCSWPGEKGSFGVSRGTRT